MSKKKNVSSLTKTCLFFGAFAMLLMCSLAGAQQAAPAPAAPAQANPATPPVGGPPPGGPPPGHMRHGGPGGPMSGPMGGPMMDPERLHKAWDTEAKTVAQDLALSPELTAKLVEAYKTARTSQMAAMREMMKPGERPDFAAMAEVNKAEKAKLETALKGFLTPEQTAKALPVLGALNRRADPSVAALDGLGLDEKTMAAAVKLILASAVESDAAMQGAAGDFRAMHEKVMETRQKLDADMAKVLSPDQMTKWKQAAPPMRGPRGMGRGPGGPGGPGGPQMKAPAPPAPPAAK